MPFYPLFKEKESSIRIGYSRVTKPNYKTELKNRVTKPSYKTELQNRVINNSDILYLIYLLSNDLTYHEVFKSNQFTFFSIQFFSIFFFIYTKMDI